MFKVGARQRPPLKEPRTLASLNDSLIDLINQCAREMVLGHTADCERLSEFPGCIGSVFLTLSLFRGLEFNV